MSLKWSCDKGSGLTAFPKVGLELLILALEILVAGISIQQVKVLVRSWPQMSCGWEIHSLVTERI